MLLHEPEPGYVFGVVLTRKWTIMEIDDNALRGRITEAVSNGLQPLSYVLAGWKCGSVAFDLEDQYSDIDLCFLLDDTFPTDQFYIALESALNAVSPIVATHSLGAGRYFKLRDVSDYLLVDVCIYQTKDLAKRLDAERHGTIRPLFDKGEWLRRDPSAGVSQTASRAKRLEEHQEWFSISQSFVHKAILRGRQIESLHAYWGYTLRPLVELLRMRYCPHRWDFGMRYLERDLPEPVYEELRRLMFVGESDDIAKFLTKATAWAERLLRELDGKIDSVPRAN